MVNNISGLQPQLQILQFMQLSSKNVRATISDGIWCSSYFMFGPDFFNLFGTKITVNSVINVIDYDMQGDAVRIKKFDLLQYHPFKVLGKPSVVQLPSTSAAATSATEPEPEPAPVKIGAIGELTESIIGKIDVNSGARTMPSGITVCNVRLIDETSSITLCAYEENAEKLCRMKAGEVYRISGFVVKVKFEQHTTLSNYRLEATDEIEVVPCNYEIATIDATAYTPLGHIQNLDVEKKISMYIFFYLFLTNLLYSVIDHLYCYFLFFSDVVAIVSGCGPLKKIGQRKMLAKRELTLMDAR